MTLSRWPRDTAFRGASVCLLFSACAVEEPPPPPAPRPEPGWALSTPFPEVRALQDVLVLEPERAWAVGTEGTILAWDGEAWAREASGVVEDLESVDGFLDEDGAPVLFAVGHAGTMVTRGANGAWSPIATGTDRVLFSVAAHAADDVFAVGDAGTVVRFDGASAAVQERQTLQTLVGGDDLPYDFPIPEPLKGVIDDGGTMIAVGARGAVYTYDANGEPAGESNRWTRENSGTTRSLAGISDDDGIFVPTIDGVIMRRNGPGDWDDDSLRTPAPVFLQDVHADGRLCAVGLSEDIYELDDSGAWLLTRVAEGAELRGVDGVRVEPVAEGEPPGRLLFAVGGGGRIVRGPLVLPGKGETPLRTRESTDDFVE